MGSRHTGLNTELKIRTEERDIVGRQADTVSIQVDGTAVSCCYHQVVHLYIGICHAVLVTRTLENDMIAGRTQGVGLPGGGFKEDICGTTTILCAGYLGGNRCCSEHGDCR